MRTAVLPLALLALAAAPLSAQTTPFVAEVVTDSVTVRSGPSDQMPETGALFRGTKVVVDHEEPNGWLAVQPPTGQVSWVKAVHLGPVDGQAADAVPRNAVVHAEPEAEVAAGRPGHGKPLDVRRTRVPDGTIVLVIGRKVDADGVGWYPIQPPDGDLRYVPSSAVRFARGQPSQSFVVRSPKTEPPASTTPPEPAGGFQPVTASLPNRPEPTSKPADRPNHPLWQQAEQAERAGEFSRAEGLYLKLAAEVNRAGGDAELANLCYTRVHAVRERQRYSDRDATPAAARRTDLPDGPSAERWVGAGVLRRAGFKVDDRTTYALVGSRGEVRCYAVSGAGVDLERFAGSEVDLYGPLTYPGDLRGAGVITAMRVQLLRVR